MPRSATTIVGSVIAKQTLYSSIYEPFNTQQGLKSVNINYVIPGINIMENDFDRILNNLFNSVGDFRNGIKESDSFIKKMTKYILGNQSSLSFKKAKYSFLKTGVLVKDPFLVFASHYLSKNYKIIMCERPLLPLAGSFKRMLWEFPEHERLLKDFGRMGLDVKNTFDCENIKISKNVIGAVKFYNLYHTFKKVIFHKENIYFFNQNDLSENPNEAIELLFDWIGEKYTNDKIQDLVNSISGSLRSKTSPKSNIQHDGYYNKKYANTYYKNILTKEEIEFIKKSQEEICSGEEI